MIRCQRHPTRRNCRAKASEGPTDDQTMSALGVPERPRRQRHCRPTTRTPTLQALQRWGQNQPGWTSSWKSWTPGSKQRSKRPGTHGKLRSPHQQCRQPPTWRTWNRQCRRPCWLPSRIPWQVQVPHAHLSHPPHQYRTRFPSKAPQPREEDQTKKGVGAHPSKLPTPVRAARLQAWLEGHDGGQKQKVVSGFKRGFDVGYKGSLPHVRPHSLTSALQNPEEVDKKLSKESSMNRVAGRFKQESFSHFRTSPLGLVERKYQANLGWSTTCHTHQAIRSVMESPQRMHMCNISPSIMPYSSCNRPGLFFCQKQTLQMPFALFLCTHRNTACLTLSGESSSVTIVGCPWVAVQAARFLRHLAMRCNG